METNPFENYSGESDYETYLEDLRTVFSGIAEQLAADGTVLVDVVNMRFDGQVTSLAWDVADAGGESLHFDGEVVITWEESEGEDTDPSRLGNYGYGYDHSYLLVFSHG